MLGPLLVAYHVELDLMWTGVAGGSLAYGAHRSARGAAMNAIGGSLWPYLVLVLVGYLPNEIWRVFGLVLARGLNEDSEIVVWSRAVATAILAGVIAKLILFAPGALAGIPLAVRVVAVACGFAAFIAARRSAFIGVAAGEAVLLLGGFLFAQ